MYFLWNNIYLVCLLLFLAPILAPNRKWLIVVIALMGAPLAYGWGEYFYLQSKYMKLGQDNSISFTMGFVFFTLLTRSFLAGMLIKLLIFIVKFYTKKAGT